MGEKPLSLPARQLVNLTRVLLSDGAGAPQGYVCVSNNLRENPFIAYGVINDGAAPVKGRVMEHSWYRRVPSDGGGEPVQAPAVG